MTKAELYDYINVMLEAGKTRQQVADLLHCDIKIVRRAAESRKYDHMLTLVMIDWDATCKPIRKYLKKRRRKRVESREVDKNNAVYTRVSSWSGYWWVSGYNYNGTFGRQQEGRR